MYHSRTSEHNKHVIQQSLLSETGTVCVIFFTNALGTGVNMASINNHYGEPRSIEDYFQECGCAGHIGDQTYSTIFYKPSNCPLYDIRTQCMSMRQMQFNTMSRKLSSGNWYTLIPILALLSELNIIRAISSTR